MNLVNKNMKLDIIDNVVIMMLFLFSLNLLNQVNYIFTGLTLFMLLWMLANNAKIKITSEFLVLIVCFMSYITIYTIYFPVSLQSIITYFIGPVAGYFIGFHLVGKNNKIKSVRILMIMSWGLFFHGMLNMLIYFKQGYTGRRIPDIWSGIGISATIQGTFFTIICSLIFYNIFINKNKIGKCLSILAILFSIYSTLQTASRTLLLITTILLIINIILYIYLNKEKKALVVKIMSYIILIASIVFTIFKFNIFGLTDIYENSALYERINREDQTELDEDPRFDMYKKVLDNMLYYPMGGNKIEGLTYAHNLWLDTAKSVGIIPFFLLVIYSIMTLFTLLKFIKYKNISDESKYIIFSMYTGLTLNFMVEPILEGVPYLFIIMCILNGVTRKELNDARRSKYYENSMVK